MDNSRLEGGLVPIDASWGPHPNAPLTPEGRRRMVRSVTDRKWAIEATAERFQVDAKTVRKWRGRWLAEGEPGLQDRSSRPHRSPNRTGRQLRRRVCRIRRKRRWGADHIAYEVGLAVSTVQSILNAAGEGRLERGDLATDREPIHRYERGLTGELIHVDIKKIADGGGWRMRDRGYRTEMSSKARRLGYRYIHTALDDRSRVTYLEILEDEQGTIAAEFWLRAARWFQAIGITPQRVIPDNGGCYKSRTWLNACRKTRTKVKKTRPYRPQTNGQVERFRRILLEEWAYIRPWRSETQRADAYDGSIHFHNHHRSHGSLGWATPTSIIQDNLPEEHT